MALLDYFAGQALIGLLSQVDHTVDGHPCPMWNGNSEDRDALTTYAYRIAESMMAARKIIAADKPS
jgi:hypothetical protein